MVDMKVLATGLRFPEGPVALVDGSIALVEIARGTVSRVTPDGEVTVIADLGGGPNGLALGPDQALYVCNNGGFEWHEEPGILRPIGQPANYSGGWIERVDQKTGEARLLYDRCGETKLKGPNDIVFDRSGGFYFTDLGKTRHRDRDWGTVYYTKIDGSHIVEVSHPFLTPNGIGPFTRRAHALRRRDRGRTAVGLRHRVPRRHHPAAVSLAQWRPLPLQ
jgi:gluconolactonase